MLCCRTSPVRSVSGSQATESRSEARTAHPDRLMTHIAIKNPRWRIPDVSPYVLRTLRQLGRPCDGPPPRLRACGPRHSRVGGDWTLLPFQRYVATGD